MSSDEWEVMDGLTDEAVECVPCEPEGVTPASAASGRYPCLTFGYERAKFWVVAEVYEKTDISLCILSRFPYPYPPDADLESIKRMPEHNIMCELEAVSVNDLFGVDGWPGNEIENLAKLLLELGVAPGQPFQVDMRLCWEKGDGWEIDPSTECEWDLIGVEYWEPEQVLKAWEDWVFGMDD